MIKKLILALGVATMFFLSAGLGSWMLMIPKETEDTEEPTAATEQVSNVGDAFEDSPSSLTPEINTDTATPEEVFRMTVLLREQQANLRREQEAAEKERVRMNLVMDDMKNQQRELDGMLVQLQEKIKTGEALLSQLADERQKLDEKQKASAAELEELKEARAEVNSSEAANTKQISRWFESMDPDQSAKVLRGIANDGELGRVVQILANIEDRNVAKILGSMDDPPLVAQITDEMQRLVRADNKAKRR